MHEVVYILSLFNEKALQTIPIQKVMFCGLEFSTNVDLHGEFLSEFCDFLNYPRFSENIKVTGRPHESFPISSSSRSLLCVRNE